MFKQILDWYDRFAGNSLLSSENQEVLRRVRIINTTILVLTVSLAMWLVFEFASQGFRFYHLALLALVLIGTKFLFWYRRKQYVYFLSNFLIGGLVATLMIFNLFYWPSPSWQLGFFVMPGFAFLLGGVYGGSAWSLLTMTGMSVIAFLDQIDLLGGQTSNVFLASWLGLYGLVVAMSLVYEKMRYAIAQKYTQKNEELLRLIYVISHDLRNPLTSIKGFISFVKDDIREKSLELVIKDLGKTDLVIGSMERIINELLDLSRIGRDMKTAEQVNTDELVKKLMIENEAQLRNKKIQAEMVGEFPTVRANPRKLEEVFRNLISNAIKYIGETPQPKIVVGVNENPDDYEFFVRDNGLGIKKEDQGKLFQLFFQRGESKQEEGTGIGLSVVKGFVEDLGGQVRVESEENRGSTFYFSLPKK